MNLRIDTQILGTPATDVRSASTEQALDSTDGGVQTPSIDTEEGGSTAARPTLQTAQFAREMSNAATRFQQTMLQRQLGTTSADDGVSIARAGSRTINGLTREQAADFTLIPSARRADLRTKAWEEFVEVYAHGDTYRVHDIENGIQRGYEDIPQLDFVDLRNIMRDLEGRTDMTDLEKAFVWSEIADAKGVGGVLGYENARLHITNRGVQRDLIDSHSIFGFGGRAWNTPSHTVVPFHDPVHGFGALEPGRYIGYAYDSLPEAMERIEEAEAHFGGNPGDVNASIASTRAFHAWRDAPEGQRFSAFADTWIREIVHPDFQ